MRIVVKVGTSTLAHPGGLLNIRHTEDLVRVWSDIQNAGHQLIVVSSAATGLGAGKLQIEKPSDLVTKQAAAAVGQCELMYTYDRLFRLPLPAVYRYPPSLSISGQSLPVRSDSCLQP